MTTTDVSNSRALADLAGGFARALKAGGQMARTDKLETTLFTKGSIDRLFVLETAIIAGWPSETPPPRHELRCDPRGAVCETLRLAAFDDEGVLLLEQSFGLAEALKCGKVKPRV